MAKMWLALVLGIIAIAIGVGMAYLWSQLRTGDEEIMIWGVGAVTTLAAFVSLYFLTKGGGGE